MKVTSGDQPIMAEIDPKLEQEIMDMEPYGMKEAKIMQVFTKFLGETLPVKVSDERLTSIQFVLDDGQEFTVKDGGSGLRIYAANGRLVIEPEASNVIQVSELKE